MSNWAPAERSSQASKSAPSKITGMNRNDKTVPARE
jgi:hypothetical protein